MGSDFPQEGEGTDKGLEQNRHGRVLSFCVEQIPHIAASPMTYCILEFRKIEKPVGPVPEFLKTLLLSKDYGESSNTVIGVSLI